MLKMETKECGCHNRFGKRASQRRCLKKGILSNQNETDKETIIPLGNRDGSGAGKGRGKRANKNHSACQGNGEGLGEGGGRGKAHNRTFPSFYSVHGNTDLTK